jgi:purine-binding chemotaxis protein CheW
MVDLVKIRKKSKDARAAADEAAQPQQPPAEAVDVVTPEPEPAAPVPAPVEPVAAVAAPAPALPPANEPAAAAPAAKAKKQAKSAPKESRPEPQPREESVPTVPSAPAVVEEAEIFDEDRLAKFKRLAGKRRTWSASATTAEQTDSIDASTGLELLRFRVAGEDYAVEIDKIVEIVPPRATTRVPNADEAIVGIMSLRGTIVTVIDLRRKLGHPRVDLDTLKDARMIVVERAGETAGFLVDRVSRVVKLDRAQLESHPVVSSAEQSEYVSGVFQGQDGLVILLDIERILAG